MAASEGRQRKIKNPYVARRRPCGGGGDVTLTSPERKHPRQEDDGLPPSVPDSAWDPGRRCVVEEDARRSARNDRREASVAALKVAASGDGAARSRRDDARRQRKRERGRGRGRGRGRRRRRRRPGCNKRPRRANMSEPNSRLVARLDLCVANRADVAGTGE